MTWHARGRRHVRSQDTKRVHQVHGVRSEPAHSVASGAEGPRVVGAHTEPARSVIGGGMVEEGVEEVMRADAIHEGSVAIVTEAARSFIWGSAKVCVGGNW